MIGIATTFVILILAGLLLKTDKSLYCSASGEAFTRDKLKKREKKKRMKNIEKKNNFTEVNIHPAIWLMRLNKGKNNNLLKSK